MKKLVFPLCIFASMLFVSSCQEEVPEPVNGDPVLDGDDPVDPDDQLPAAAYATGWTGEDDLSSVPTATSFGFGNGELPSSVDLTAKFPPIGDQGQYGTCVAWAVGYNLKTALTGMDLKMSAADLGSVANQFSPKDLFTAIPDAKKGQDCNGTNFTEALEVMLNRGIATLQTVPYTSLSNCSETNMQAEWTTEANKHKIQYYRKIDASVQSIKQNLAKNIPVILGAKLADNFMTWNSDEVITSHTTYNHVGQHAYHAMMIAGYDDSKGPGGAFRVINSWGNSWGDQGYIWVDYDFLINEFCVSFNGEKPLFIAANGDHVNPPDDNDNDNVPVSSGVDLAPWIFADYSTYQSSGNSTERLIEFNLYNIGNQAATPDANWSYYYIYYNAYDANDYGVLFYDDFNTKVAPNTFECPTGNNCVFNVSIQPGSDFSSTVWGWSSITRTYYMPQITGEYYLVMIADAMEGFQEQDEQNNFFYTTMQPKYFQAGYGARYGGKSTVFEFRNNVPVSRDELNVNQFNSSVKQENRNAYSPEEIWSFIRQEKKNGNLDDKIHAFMQRKNTQLFQQN